MNDSNRRIKVRGFSRIVFLALLLIFSAATAAYLWFTAGIPHGIGAAIVLGLGSLGLAAYAGPVERVREFKLDDDGLTILRFTRVRSRLAWSEIAQTRVSSDPLRLLLTPHDPADFFTRHRELDVSRQGPYAVLRVGRDRAAAEALTDAASLRCKSAPAVSAAATDHSNWAIRP